MSSRPQRTSQRRGLSRLLTRPLLPLLAACLIVGAGRAAVAMDLQSPAFSLGGEIPMKYTCDGADLSPPLRWSGPPAKTRGFALITDDPDAPGGTWVHWVLYGIAASVRELPEGVQARETVADIGIQGVNDFRKLGYGGPCPPRGTPHRYYFTLYALDVELSFPPRKTKAEILKAMQGHILGQAQATGLYKRR
ncbi:MAG TPA: YbhB/YbcL family Raf kinase inhibitor-like protein [Candidatus Methylomirabilis sp.]|nr:YbhB/YbcL family Raf kinase inhibitor-like protein [Candidatus Methylomirabilis sp.]